MDLPPGSRLGPYELLSPLGSGGMGDVYRARDTRLGREVALKVPTAGRLADPSTRARFEREMAIVAKLIHPRICTLLDAGTEGDQPYFAMELLHGETLATRLDRAGSSGLPVQEALDIAAGICDALAFAHRHGVVHRDLKPDNVMLTPGGVKLLDFGIAQLRASDGTTDARSGTATLAIVGTPAYMAPEQIDGRADARSDLFSLGAVLYEMLAGRRAFPGETSSDILGAVVRCAPQPLAEVRPDLPPAVVRLVHRCLRKDVDERWQSATDLGEALRWTQDPAALPTGATAPRLRRLPGWAWGLMGALGALAVAIAALVPGRGAATPPAPEFYVDDIALPDGERFLVGQSSLSRDGRRLAVATMPASGNVLDTKLWTREIGSGGDWQLSDGAGPESVSYPSWSPDGQSLTYFRAGKLVRVSLASQMPVSLAEAPNGRGTAWLDSDTIVYAPDPQGDIWKVPAQGGTPTVVVRRQASDRGLKFPVALEGDQFLFWAQQSSQAASEIRVASVRTPDKARSVVRSPSAGAYGDEHLFFVQDNILVAQRLDPRTWALRGHAAPLPIEAGMGTAVGAPYVSTGGGVVSVQSVRREASELTWVDRAGTPLGTIGTVAAHRTMALSPDGQQLLVERAAPGVDLASIWLVDLQSGAARHIVTEVGAMNPIWHPDQDRMAFRASLGPGGSGAVYEQSVIGGLRRALVEIPAAARPVAWVDRTRLVWWGTDPTGRFNGIFLRDDHAADRPYRTLRVGAEFRGVVLRPGATGVAYMSDESGIFEVHADTFPTPRPAAWRVSGGGGSLPKWSRDGRELFFVSDGALHVVAMTGQDGAPSGTPRRLFPFEGRYYDVHPDGRVLIERLRRPETQYLRVFLNWAKRPAADRPEDR